ncbi:hypothetical protein C6361_36300 [Plantactinospora sp. BC1]|nr:hypothetical protein C6361_36300 [Plantactinospora sp. BC1]
MRPSRRCGSSPDSEDVGAGHPAGLTQPLTDLGCLLGDSSVCPGDPFLHSPTGRANPNQSEYWMSTITLANWAAERGYSA